VTFAALALVCCTIGFFLPNKQTDLPGQTIALFALAFLLTSGVATLLAFKKVTHGKYSYSENTLFWEYIMQPEVMKRWMDVR
jgi:hypothetical protein